MSIEQKLNKKNKLLLADLRIDFQIDFESKDINYCEVFTKNGYSTIYYNPKIVDDESIAHELLHIQLKRYDYVIGNYIYSSCQNHKKLGKVFSCHRTR
jgi:Zn-dependent peptidase ImmA (M78 family)